MKKAKDLFCVALIYLLAYGVGVLAALPFDNRIVRFFMFDLAATVVTFVFSAALSNSSVYDPYWSLTPMVMAVWLFVEAKAFSVWQILFLLAFCLWSVRLTVNWILVFTDFSYEDWRYRMLREQNGKFMWWIVNFCGIHLVPTLVVFAGMLPLFEICRQPMNALCLPGIAVILFGTALEFFADRQMHSFLRTATGKTVLSVGLWRYSRHPNYLGEISVWLGTFLAMLPAAPEKWYYGIGFVLMIALFNFISIPMAERRQLARRPDYKSYRAATSRLLLLPCRNTGEGLRND